MDERSANRTSSGIARIFREQPERMAAAWRRVLGAKRLTRTPPCHLLDCVVEGFVRELGASLAGAPGSAWTRTRGVLRLSPERGTHGLLEEFSALRRCLEDAADVLGGGEDDLRVIRRGVDEALRSALTLHRRLTEPLAPPPEVPFGGVVVEFFERTSGKERVTLPAVPAAVH